MHSFCCAFLLSITNLQAGTADGHPLQSPEFRLFLRESGSVSLYILAQNNDFALKVLRGRPCSGTIAFALTAAWFLQLQPVERLLMKNGSVYRRELTINDTKKLNEICRQLPDYVVSYLNARASNCRLSTRIAYAGDLVIFFNFLCETNPVIASDGPRSIPMDILDQLTFEDINEFQAYLDHGIRADGHMFTNTEAAKARRMSSIRSFFKYEYSHGYLKNDPTAGAERIRLKKDKMIERLNVDEVHTLMDSVINMRVTKTEQPFCKRTNLRDTAILTLLLNTGIRISELVGLDVDDVDFKEMSVYVIRKGGKPDRVFFNDTVAGALNDYIEAERPVYLPSKDEKALFLSNRKQRMKIRSIQEMIKKYGASALPQRTTLSPHKMRKTYGTALYDQTGDIKLVADVLGHDSVDTTARHYIDSSTEHKKRAAGVKTY